MNTDMTGRVETCRMNTDIQGQIETFRMKTSMIYVYIYIFLYLLQYIPGFHLDRVGGTIAWGSPVQHLYSP